MPNNPIPQRASMLVLGGSSMYVLLLFQALAKAGVLPRLRRITLFGRDEARLAFLARAGNTLAAGACEVDVATDYASCIDADYDIVFNQIRFGGMASRDLDERAALDAGCCADETLGMVGVSNAIRTITGMASYVAPFVGRARQPRWINFTNPCSIVTQYLVDTLGPGPIGICDYPQVFRRKIAAFLEAPEHEVQIDYFGVNHFAFVHEVRLDGRPVLGRLLAKGARFEPAIAAQAHLDYLVVPSWDMVFDPAPLLARQRAHENRAAALLDIERQCQQLVDAGQRDPAPVLALLAQRDCAWYELAVAPLLAQCLGEGGETIVNLPMGDVFGLGEAFGVVETNAVVDSHGARALAIPEALRSNLLFDYCRSMKRAERLLLRAILAGDPRGVAQACLANPMIGKSGQLARYGALVAAAAPQIAHFFENRTAS